MFGEKAIELIKEVDRNRDILSPYNRDLIEKVGHEICDLIKENHIDAQANIDAPTGSNNFIPTVRIRHICAQRNVRCLLAYHYNRLRCLRTMRWEFGSLLPADIKVNLSDAESVWFSKYSAMLAKYMRNITEDGGINLGVDLKPPKSLFIEVRCLVDYGKHQMSDGSILLLKKNSRYYLPRSECEEFIRLEIFEHIVS